MVQVLSNTTVVTACNFSKLSAFLIKIPWCAPLPTQTIIAVGVAKPSAHGHAITSTATNDVNHIIGNHRILRTIKLTIAIPSTTGTKIAEIRSASLWIGALEPCASCTIVITRERKLSLPSVVALILRNPCLLMVPPITESQTILSTGSDSPVTIDSSTLLAHSIILPSTGIFPHGFTCTISPACTSSKPISTTSPFLSTNSVFACK